MSAPASSTPFFGRTIRESDVRAAVDRLVHASVFRNEAVFWLLALSFACLFFLETVPFLWDWNTDSPSYYTAALGLRAGINIYDDGQFQALADQRFGKSMTIYPYIYPPLLAQISLPLTALPLSSYFYVMYAMNILLTFFGLYLLIDLLELRARDSILPALFPFALLLSNEAVLTTIHHGQVNVAVFDVILLALVFQKKEKPLPVAFFLSLAVFLKIYPILFVLPLVFSKRIKALAYFAGSCGALLTASVFVSGPSPWADFGRSTIQLFLKKADSPFTRAFQNHLGNVSLKGFLAQAFPRAGLPESLLSPAFVVLAAVLVGSVFVLPRRNSAHADRNSVSSLLFILTVLLAPITWSHHYVILLFPAAYLFDRLVAEGRYPALLLLLLLASQIFYRAPWGGFPFNQIRLIASLGLFAMLLDVAAGRRPGTGLTGPFRRAPSL